MNEYLKTGFVMIALGLIHTFNVLVLGLDESDFGLLVGIYCLFEIHEFQKK